jgi:hypothetical protein
MTRAIHKIPQGEYSHICACDECIKIYVVSPLHITAHGSVNPNRDVSREDAKKQIQRFIDRGNNEN